MKVKKLSQFILVFLVLLAVGTTFADEKTSKVDKILASWNKPDTPGCALYHTSKQGLSSGTSQRIRVYRSEYSSEAHSPIRTTKIRKTAVAPCQ